MTTNPIAAPWHIIDDLDGHEVGIRAIVDADGYTICAPSPMGTRAAALIASAPELLEALRTIAANASSVQMEPQWAVQIARNAIAKATGHA